ncbi:methyltransferase domain-containing protein [Streptomyces sp. NPDC050418]|uniref:methyltransferase domain-containing protein n=1 Tax=Streptomyces sp. NPDC050418 TaxID=3365612 RepID=UPI0037A0C55E
MSTHPTGSGQDPIAHLIAQLDALDAMPEAQWLRSRTYELLAAGPGRRVVDVGCGPGRAVGELSGLGAEATGIDLDPQMLRVARERHPKADLRAADLAELPFADGTLDGYRADKVLHTVADPGHALAEARRVLVPGGRAVLAGQDWDTFVIDAKDAALTRTIVRSRADLVTSPRAARGHRSLLLGAGFTEVGVEVHTAVFTGAAALPMLAVFASAARDAGAITSTEYEAWLADQRQRAGTDRLFVAVPLFVAVGTRT